MSVSAEDEGLRIEIENGVAALTLDMPSTRNAFGSAVAAVFAWGISGSIPIALVMMAAMICNMLIGATIGVLVPVVRTRFGKDPAMGSSVLLTFATDSLGFFIFLGLATIFLL